MGCALATGAVAWAQRMDVRRPLTLTVGRSDGPAATVRSDAHRDGLVHGALPRGLLHVDWHFAAGAGQIEQPPLVTADAIIVITTHGDVVWIPHDAHDHGEPPRQSIGIAAASTSAPALLSDGTVVVVGGSSDAVAVGVNKNGVVFRTQLVGGLPVASNQLDAIAPLALDDGGVVVATSAEIALLDASGNVRVRAPLPEAISGPLLASGGASPSSRRIFAVSKTGVVFAWSPGGANGRDVTRMGSFQGEASGGAVLSSDESLVAVVNDSAITPPLLPVPRLMTIDVRQGLAVPLATFAGGAYLGPVAFRNGVAYALAGLPGHTFAVGVDSGGQEVLRVPVGSSTALAPDGGIIAYSVPLHVPVIVDETGALAYAAPEGPVGVVDPAGIVASLDNLCIRSLRGGRGVTSLVSGGPGAFIITCGSGSVLRIIHGDAP
jgi:hypothetical protein